MSNAYILPLCFAAATHGALLFGFSKDPTTAPRPVEKIRDLIPFVLRPPEEAPPIVVDDEAARAPVKTPATVLPPIRGPEPEIAVDTTRPAMTPPPIQPIGSNDVKTILGPDIGTLDGQGTNPWNRGVIGHEFLDNPPRTRFQSAPLYPYQAKREGMSGEVFVDFMVNEQGRVMEPRVVKSSHPMFEEPTLRAIAKWQFEPGRRDGKIVRFRMTVPVVFNLNEGS